MKTIKLLAAIIVLPTIAVLATALWLYSSLNSPHQHDKSVRYVQVEKGSAPNQIIGELAHLANDLVKDVESDLRRLRLGLAARAGEDREEDC